MGYKIDKNGVLVKAKLNKKNNNVTIPTKVTTIGNGAFAGTEFLRKVYIPENVTQIEASAFKSCKYLTEVTLPSTLKRLDTNTFFNCNSLQTINIPSELVVIDSGCFSGCFSLEHIEFPSTLNCLGKEAFYNTGLRHLSLPDSILWIADRTFKKCDSLKSVKLPSNIEILGDRTFEECSSLKKIELPESIKIIGNSCFAWCSDLKEVTIPSKVTSLNDSLFLNCRSLKNVTLHDNITSIEEFAFCNCESLETIKLPSKLKSIAKFSFSGCESLKEIDIPKGVSVIGDQAFSKTNIKKIVIPEATATIGEKCFYECKELESVVLPSSLNKIPTGLFYRCESLKRIDLPETIENIGSQAFDGCKNIESFNLPEGLRKINSKAFAHSGIKNISIPSTVDYVGEHIFTGCENLETVRISNYSLLYSRGILDLIFRNTTFYFDEETSEIVIATSKLKNDNLVEIDYRGIIEELNCNKSSGVILGALFKKENLTKSIYIKDAIEMFTKQCINKGNYREVTKKLSNNKEFNLLCKRVFPRYNETKALYCNDLLKLAYTMGIFNDDKIERQKACEFLSNAFENNKLSIHKLHGSFESLKFNGYNKEWAEFLMNKENFEKLLLLEKEETGYIAKIYNNFEKIKEFSRSNRGSQRYRKITVEICEKYFVTASFEDVDEENIDIASELSKYTRDQSSFEEAVKIRDEYQSMRNVNAIREHIIDGINDVLNNLNEVSNNKFTCEFLAKSDPLNFTLGKYCSCCAHIEGEGRGIMKASILHPDCQNLIIRNSRGVIIAKSTLYVNRKQGYGVFNNIEINSNIINDDKVKEMIYKKYIAAVKGFVLQYNKENPSRPLKQINIGMGLNDLRQQFHKFNEKSSEILEGIDFSDYGGYRGDWQMEQYVIWKDDIKKNR